jgi:acetyl-CoA acetyltransferase
MDRALADAGLTLDEIDAIVVGKAPDLFEGVMMPELYLAESLGLGDDVSVNPSGGALAANPIMAAGLIRLGEAAARISGGEANRAIAHATSGVCLQQNLVCVLEGE